MKGFFSIKVTLLGANMCLLEENEKGDLKLIASEGKDWLVHL